MGSGVIGALGGLAFVYCVYPAPIRDLEHYRPISNTVLYDDQGRVLGTFALQRRAIAQFEDYPAVLYNAFLSVEDKNFEKQPGLDIYRLLVPEYHILHSLIHVHVHTTHT